jgi:orotate phosphoribosyltransferase
VLRRIARLFVPVIAEVSPDLVGGTELGGLVVATAVSQLSGVPMIAVRKKPKAYGAFANEFVEGPYAPGQHVLLLEDVVTNGSDLLAASSRLRELGLKVTPYAVISRGLAPVRALIQFSLPVDDPKIDN